MELCIKNISKSYGKNKALSDFSMMFTSGIYALLGPNGSGKSTLMNIITDNLKADAGEIFFDGENVKKMGMAVVTFDKLPKTIIKEAKGLVLNPASYRLQIGTEQLGKIVAANFEN